MASTETAPIRYILSKDETVQIAAPVCDALHALIWGRLCLSTTPHADTLLTETADPFAWVREQRMAQQASPSVRLARLRTNWLAVAEEITMARAA
jgi:hypothetical protein